jgi:oligoendopeptidase F
MRRTTLLLLILLSVFFYGFAQERDRSSIPLQWQWNLADLYPSDDAWKQAKEKFVAAYPTIEQFKGTLGSSPRQLLQCLETRSSLTKELSRLYVYTSLHSDQDTRDSKYLEMLQGMGQLVSDFNSATAFIEPEILKVDPAMLSDCISGWRSFMAYQSICRDRRGLRFAGGSAVIQRGRQ